jgi:hypothetical protein
VSFQQRVLTPLWTTQHGVAPEEGLSSLVTLVWAVHGGHFLFLNITLPCAPGGFRY